MPTFAGRPSTMSYLRWIFRRIPWLDNKGSKYPNCNSSVRHNLFWCWNIRFKNQATTCSDFPSETLFWINEVEMVLFIGRIEISAISLWNGFSKLRDAGREYCLCSEEDHPEFPVQEECQHRGAESPERGSVSTRKLDAMFPCHDVFRFADLASVGKSLLDRNTDHLLNQARSERTCETKTSSGISWQLYRKTFGSSLCSMIGIAGRTTRKYWISKRTISSARRIIDEGTGWFSEILKSEVQEKIMRHHKNSLLGCKKCNNRWILFRSHIGSRAISVQVSIVEVSNNVFHS